MENPQAFLGRLRPIYIFKGLTDDQILEAAKALAVERHPAGAVIFEQGEVGQDFYIIDQGQVKVLRAPEGRAPKLVATLVPGDFFGERSLLYGRKRSATIEAASDVELLRLEKADFDELLRRYPQIRPNLLLSTESLDLMRRNRFRWLGKDEVIYLIARKHRIRLYMALFWPIAAGLLLALAAVWLALYFENMAIAWAGAALEALAAGWLLWVYVDWGNDFYIVTSQRIVHLEKIVAIYDSRQEAPLTTIRAVDVATADPVQRILNMGDVVVNTFSGPITLKSVPNPTVMAAAIEQHWDRMRLREQEANETQRRQALRERIERGPEVDRPPARRQRKPQPQARSFGEELARFFSFQVRFEEGSSVVYRKHWFILAGRIWKPSLGLGLVAAGLAAAAAGLLPALPLVTALLVALVVFVPLAGWWLYEFIDWHNDIYMVTEDQILDIAKKPLGTERKKSAPLESMQSLKYERPGLLGVLLNYGTVVAHGIGVEFRFEGVFDPVSVQADVYRRMEALQQKRKAADEARRNREMADWLATYHRLEEEGFGTKTEARQRDQK